jgi:hypothetical protein
MVISLSIRHNLRRSVSAAIRMCVWLRVGLGEQRRVLLAGFFRDRQRDNAWQLDNPRVWTPTIGTH